MFHLDFSLLGVLAVMALTRDGWKMFPSLPACFSCLYSLSLPFKAKSSGKHTNLDSQISVLLL